MTPHRPTTRGELLTCLKAGTKCEVASYVVEITNLCLDYWLKFAGKYNYYPSENEGWTVYEPIKTTEP